MRRQPDLRWVLNPLSLLICGLFGAPAAWADSAAAPAASTPAPANAAPSGKAAAQPPEDVQFNPVFLNQTSNGQQIDLSRFNQMGGTLPGNYRADVYANGVWVGRRDVLMKSFGDKAAQACLNRSLLDDLGLEASRLPSPQQLPGRDELARCVEIGSIVPGAFSSFNSADLRLDVSIPQRYQRARARGYVAPEYWDAGAPVAGFLNYNANVYRAGNSGQGNSTQYYLSANSGVNIGLWRLRYDGTLTQQDSNGLSQRNYQNTAAYAQHDLTAWHSVLTVGDYFTPSDLFSSVSFRGVQILSDDRMLPESLQGYAPVVRGVAETNAKVSVRQNGNLIYENTVAPGEFSIDDLYNTGFSGDLEVTVTESDGRVRKFIVPYAAVPQLLREGRERFAFTAGQWRSNSLSQRPGFAQATYQRGISNSLTAYGGAILAEHYQSALLGAGINTAYGALALDVTQSWAGALPESLGLQTMQGQSYRLSFSKLMEKTRTNFTVAAYRFSTANYLEFQDYANLLNGSSSLARAKNQFQLNVDQPLGGSWGHVFLTGTTQDYWNQTGRNTTYQLGYGNSFKRVSLNVSAGRSRDSNGRNINQFLLSLTMPLGSGAGAPLLSASAGSSSDQSRNEQVSVSGVAGDLRNLSYNVYANNSYANTSGNSNSGGASVQYASSVASFSAGGSVNGSNTQTNAGVSGALVFHPGGVTAAQALGESIAVIEAPGAEGAAVANTNGVRINHDGYAVVSSLMPYRQNEITLDPKNMNQDVELLETSALDAPRAGAIVTLKFNTQQGKPVIVALKRPGGGSLPVGAEINDGKGEYVALIGQGGRAFIRGMEGQSLTASWGSGRDQQCRFQYQLPHQNASAGYLQTEALCQPLQPEATAR
ncbi:fimbria/pilus outer membrane usher protein [Chromobacterium sp. IIBBL 290-4]|uniref:fimbria/pilus outer membrane usher protein n=1 Tax=Chromobacterium sp. IIBBL 290-4 TaxID=2953890 RepID=UPI0020B7F69E|nr:fimbria/pilus outer membrane usher protein [Chromobacterium sp. IIBBL 290-4]UTH74785.1 fimbrial biogenesis outer membrane usher protein [Chromobacterium sp. IIBBL 290-4]